MKSDGTKKLFRSIIAAWLIMASVFFIVPDTVTAQEPPDVLWPDAPEIAARSAILVEADTGVILYGMNIHERLYPASTTKILTCLLAAENGNPTDTVTISRTAVDAVPSDGSNIGMSAGEYMTLEQCLYGIMVGSANEVSNAVAEYVDGSIEAFADRMNERAAELGCTDSHFVNPNGLHDDEHYTSVYDLSLISMKFFENEFLSRISGTGRYHFEQTEGQPDDFWVKNKHRLINGDMPYDGVIGGKTGYTSKARETLVTCAMRGQMKLICIVFFDESPVQFTDTIALLDYGFDNFKRVKVSEEAKILPSDSGLWIPEAISGEDVFYEFTDSGSVVIPKDLSVSDLDYKVLCDREDDWPEDAVMKFSYSLCDTDVGFSYIRPTDDRNAADEYSLNQPEVVVVDVIRIVSFTLAGAFMMVVISVMVARII